MKKFHRAKPITLGLMDCKILHLCQLKKKSIVLYIFFDDPLYIMETLLQELKLKGCKKYLLTNWKC